MDDEQDKGEEAGPKPKPPQRGDNGNNEGTRYRKAGQHDQVDEEHMISDGDTSQEERQKRHGANVNGSRSSSSECGSSDNDGGGGAKRSSKESSSSGGNEDGKQAPTKNAGQKRDRSNLRKGKWTVSSMSDSIANMSNKH